MVSRAKALSITWSTSVFLVAVTGGIASGKSAFCRMLADEGAVRLDADEEAGRALEAPELLPKLRALFGNEVVASDDTINRAHIAARVFDNPTKRTELEALIHPVVRARFQDACARLEAGQILAYDVPLLFEAGLADDFDLVVVVTAPLEMRKKRALARSGWTEAEFMAREKAQIPLKEKETMGDLVVSNDGEEAPLRKLAKELMERIRSADPGRAVS